MITKSSDIYWQLLFKSGLLDEAVSTYQSLAGVMRIYLHGVGREARYGHAFPVIPMRKLFRLLETAERSPNQPTLDLIAACFVLGIGLPHSPALADFLMRYCASKEPLKVKELKYILKHATSFLTKTKESCDPYPYFVNGEHQSSNQTVLESLACTKEEIDKRIKVPEGYPVFINTRRSGHVTFNVTRSLIFYNGMSIDFTLPWHHSSSKLPTKFELPLKRDCYGMLGIITLSRQGMEDVFNIGQYAPSLELKLPPSLIALREKADSLKKSNPAKSSDLRNKVKRRLAEFDEQSAITQMRFYPIDILICKDNVQAMDRDYKEVESRILTKLRAEDDFVLDSKLGMSVKGNRRWNLKP